MVRMFLRNLVKKVLRYRQQQGQVKDSLELRQKGQCSLKEVEQTNSNQGH